MLYIVPQDDALAASYEYFRHTCSREGTAKPDGFSKPLAGAYWAFSANGKYAL